MAMSVWWQFCYNMLSCIIPLQSKFSRVLLPLQEKLFIFSLKVRKLYIRILKIIEKIVFVSSVKYFQHVWTPDVIIHDLVSFNKPEILNQVGALEIFKNKKVYYKVRWVNIFVGDCYLPVIYNPLYCRSDITVVCKAMEFGQFPWGNDIRSQTNLPLMVFYKKKIYIKKIIFDQQMRIRYFLYRFKKIITNATFSLQVVSIQTKVRLGTRRMAFKFLKLIESS